MIVLTLMCYGAIMVVVSMYALHSYHMLYLHWKWRRQPPRVPPTRLPECPAVTIQLPIYNEKYVVARLIKSIVNFDYPREKLNIQVLDDSSDETLTIAANLVRQYQAAGYRITHLTRGNRQGFKAGALQYGLERTADEFVAIFDADFVPPPDFLTKLLPEFGDPTVGGVQARWGHINPDDSWLTRAQTIALDNHFVMEQELRSRAGYFINFNGTCGIWRTAAIRDAGGWHSDTLAEDLDLSYRVQLRNWRIVYRGDCVVPGELPDTVDGYRIQQNRWARGTVQVARKLLLPVMRARLRPWAKYEAFVHLTCHVNFLAMLGIAILSLPIVYLKVEGLVGPEFYYFASLFTIGALGYPLLYYLSQRRLYPDYGRRLPYMLGTLAFSMGLSVSNTKALLEGLSRRKIVFARTPKSGGSHNRYRVESRMMVPALELALGLYMFFSLMYICINLQWVLMPFVFFYMMGFLNMGLSSLRVDHVTLRSQEV